MNVKIKRHPNAQGIKRDLEVLPSIRPSVFLSDILSFCHSFIITLISVCLFVSQHLSITLLLLWWHLLSLLGVLRPGPQLHRPCPPKLCHSPHLSELRPLLNAMRMGLPGQTLLEWKHGSPSITNTRVR